MHVVPITAKPARRRHRHYLRTLTYVTVDEGNGGIIRNLNHQGVAVQTVAPLRPGQHVRVRFELHHPRVPIEARGEVSWADSSGQSGIRFIDLPPRKRQQLNQWIFGNLLETLPQQTLRSGGLFEIPRNAGNEVQPADGLLISNSPRDAIRLDDQESVTAMPARSNATADRTADEESIAQNFDLDWLSQPLSGTALALAIDTLIVFAGMLVFFLVFFFVSGELPEWPLNVGLALATAVFVSAFYWGFFHTMAGTTLGASLARLADGDFRADESSEKSPRFR